MKRQQDLHATRLDSASLDAALLVWRTTQVDERQVAALAERLAPQLAAPSYGSAAGARRVSWNARHTLVSIVLLAAAGLYFASHSVPAFGAMTRTAARPQQTRAAQRDRPAPSLTLSSVAPLTPAPPPDPAQIPTAAPPSAAARTRLHRPHAIAAVTDVGAETELALLQRSQAALDRQPDRALQLAKQHQQRFPEGVFAQEREIIAMEALLKLHEKSQAVARAESFIRQYPDSPHARRVRALLMRNAAASHVSAADATTNNFRQP